MMGEGFAGTTKGSFFEAPSWVNKEMAAGRTNQAVVYGDWMKVLKGYYTAAYFFYSPNLVWFAIAALGYYLFPYDFEAAKEGLAVKWVLYRFLVNFVITFGYFGFWNLSLYKWGWGKRKFNTTKNPTASRMFHNMWYSLWGVIQWTAWEACFVTAYASGRLPYVDDDEAFSTPLNILKMAAWTLFVPLWRDFHFYFAHRLLHYRVLYKHVHSLHHRNSDIEPFSGLCMHPIEHLFYFSCVGPSLFIHASPFIMMWNGIHLLISPAASHSGWEDHFQSDQFHYLHHAKFECNYGTSGPPLDKLFGTFREKLGRSLMFKGVSEDIKEIVAKPNEYLSGALTIAGAMPQVLDTLVYNCLAYACLITFAVKAYAITAGVDMLSSYSEEQMAMLLSYGPIACGFVTLIIFGDKRSFMWPFAKEKVVGAMGIHLVIAYIMVVYPVHAFGQTILKDVGSAPYFSIFPNAAAAAATGNASVHSVEL